MSNRTESAREIRDSTRTPQAKRAARARRAARTAKRTAGGAK